MTSISRKAPPYGARVQRARHPDLDEYIADAIAALRAGAYTRPLFSSTCAVSDTKYTLDSP